MAGVKLQVTSDVITVSDDPQTLIQLLAATNHGFLVYRIKVDVDPNAITTPVVATLHVEKQSTAGTMSTPSPVWVIKAGPDPETVQTTLRHTATAEPTAADIVGTKKMFSVGGTGIIPVIFTWPKGLKVDTAERLGLVITYTAAGDPATFSKVVVTARLEE